MTIAPKRSVLITARDLIQKGWTQCSEARTGRGKRATRSKVTDPNSDHFCLTGAIRRSVWLHMRENYNDLQMGDHARMLISYVGMILGKREGDGQSFLITELAVWNDRSTRRKKSVIALMDAAIEESNDSYVPISD